MGRVNQGVWGHPVTHSVVSLLAKKYSRMVNISDDLHLLAVAVAGGLSPPTFLSRVARAPLPPWFLPPAVWSWCMCFFWHAECSIPFPLFELDMEHVTMYYKTEG